MEAKEFYGLYHSGFTRALEQASCQDPNGDSLQLEEGITQLVQKLATLKSSNKKVIIIGNGGSAGIASHMSTDYSKNGGIRAMAFNDSSLLTCLANDYSYSAVFEKALEIHADPGDIVFCISSSGKSPNILNAAKKASELGCTVITFSGFNEDNPLRSGGELNFYVPSNSYGYVEILHLYLIHVILDTKLYCEDKVDIFNANKLL